MAATDFIGQPLRVLMLRTAGTDRIASVRKSPNEWRTGRTRVGAIGPRNQGWAGAFLLLAIIQFSAGPPASFFVS